MRPFLLLTLTVALTSVPVAAEEPAASFSDPIYGFSLDVPRLGEAAAPVIQRVFFSGPPAGGFAANCNVQVQFVALELAAYLELTARQLEAASVELVSTRERSVSDRPAAVIEYAGNLTGRELRFLALAVDGSDRIWLLTCAAPIATFEQYRAEFERVLDSFEVSAPTAPP